MWVIGDITVLTEPLTIKEMKEQLEADDSLFPRITGVVKVELGEVIDRDLEGFLDLLSERLTNDNLLMDIQYNIVGHIGNTLFIKVTGDPTETISFEEDF